mmetsp:Transcript_7366/g.13572  ORF Transcript_7366/g.13572 Transcript_7366/m.13572 type:complete len:401 (+) Transcript_7366:1-1203(+)
MTLDEQAERPSSLPPTTPADEEDKLTRKKDSAKPRQYLVDRANGTSQLDPSSRPPCFLCWVPKPVVWFSDYIETNAVFDALGRYGWVSPDNLVARRVCLSIGLACNLMAFVLQFYVCFATATAEDRHNLLIAASFSEGFVSPKAAAISPELVYPYSHRLDMGIRAVAEQTEYWTNRTEFGGPDVLLYDEFCETPQVDVVFPNGECETCRDASKSIMISLYISVVMYIPSITTDVLRLYPHYDVNCQKIFGGFAAVISVAFALYTFISYQFKCFRNFGFGSICVSNACDWLTDPWDSCQWKEIDEFSHTCPAGFYVVQRNFWAGPGWIALAIASGFKIIDMLMNIAIPTPSICWTLEEQQEYEDKYGPQHASSVEEAEEEEATKNNGTIAADDNSGENGSR